MFLCSRVLEVRLSTCVSVQSGDTAAIWASRCGHLPVLEALIRAGADLDIKGQVSERVSLETPIIIRESMCDVVILFVVPMFSVLGNVA